jgi:SAM-dependent methyltransferase
VKFCDHFTAVADAYASRRPRYPGELFAYLSRVVRGHDLAWDCAAGSGQATLPLADYFRRVLGTDISGAMLAKAPPHPSVEYRTASAYDSGLESHSADLVTVAQGLHWLDPEHFYAEADRVLRPAGVLAVWTYGNQVLEDSVLNDLIDRFYRGVVGPYWPPERQHVETGYRTLAFPYPELDHPTFQMQETWTLGELLGYVGTWSATQLYRQARGVDPIPELAARLQPVWGDPHSSRLVRWPLSLRVGRREA